MEGAGRLRTQCTALGVLAFAVVPRPWGIYQKRGDFWRDNRSLSAPQPGGPGGSLQPCGLVDAVPVWPGCRSRLPLPPGRRAGAFVGACVT